MNSNPNNDTGDVTPDSFIEEYVLGHLTPEQESVLMERLKADATLCKRLKNVQEDVKNIQEALNLTQESTENQPLSEEILALFLDKALPEKDKARVELLLSNSRENQRKLVELYRRVREALDTTKEIALAEERAKPAPPRAILHALPKTGARRKRAKKRGRTDVEKPQAVKNQKKSRRI